ncbi:MAG TPA: ribonuclease HIII [Ktedonobacteraceae bacterium]
MMSTMDGKHWQTNIEAFKAFVAREHFSITREREIPSGYQFIVTDGTSNTPISFYTTGTVLIQGAPGALQEKIKSWQQEQATTHTLTELSAGTGATPTEDNSPVLSSGSVKTHLSRTTQTGREALFHVPSDEIEKVKQMLSGLSPRTIVQEAPGQSLIFRIDMYKDTERAKERVVASQYKNGTLQVQGKGELFDSVCLQLKTALLQSFAERGAQFVPARERHALFEHMNRPQTERMALEWAYKYLGEQAFELLAMNDRETYLSGVGLFQSIQEMNLQLPDYSIVVMPFARAYEGFIIQLVVQLGITTQETMLANAKVTKIGEYLNQIKDKIERTDKTQYSYLIETLQSAWRGVRNKVMHSDPANPLPYTQLSYAEQDIQAIHRAISLGDMYLVERGILKQAETQVQPSQQEEESVQYAGIDTEGLRLQLLQDHYEMGASQEAQWIARKDRVSIVCPSNQKGTTQVYGEGRTIFAQNYANFLSQVPDMLPQSASHTAVESPSASTKTSSRARIGMDESGKGDYFGPLVIAAVYVDEKTEPQLVALGVRDSKQLQDNRILKLAEEIKGLCQYDVVPISPKAYNKLYSEIGNLNRLLAWGHARALENVLKKGPCDLAVADQFGDEKFLRDALLSKGRKIQLEQRPRAEEDIAVAAASILARAEFVRRIELLSRQLGRTLPKGSSDPTIVTIGCEIFSKGGDQSLSEVAKMHFKTTRMIAQS